MRMSAAAALALALAAAAPAAFAQEPAPAAEKASPGEEAFFRAYYLETGLRDFAKAAEAYAKVAEDAAAGGQKALQVKALLGRGRCLRVQGKADESRAAFEAAQKIDPANEDAKAFLAAPSGGRDQEVQERIDYLVENGLTGGNPQESARELRLLVPRCFPALEAALRDSKLRSVEAAATFLASVDSAQARAILLRALRDPDVVYRSAVARCACAPRNIGFLGDNVRPFSFTDLPLLAEVSTLEDREVRSAVAARLVMAQDGRLPEEGTRILGRLLETPDHEMRKRILNCGWSTTVWKGLAPAVRTLLSSDDAAVRFLAATACRMDRGLAEALDDALRARIVDDSPEVRRAAFDASKARLPEAELARLLEGDDSGLAASAADVLRQMSTWSPDTMRAARAAIARAMKGELPADRASVVMNLTINLNGGVLQTQDFVNLYVESAPASHLGQYRVHLVERILGLLRNRSGQWKAEAPDVVEAGVSRLLQQPEPLAYWVSAFMNSGIDSPGAWALATRALEPKARRYAYEGISRVAGTPRAVRVAALPYLGEDLRSGDSEMRGFALRVAQVLPSPALAEGLRALRAEARPDDRWLILEVLVASAGKGALPEVREDLASADEGLRRQALRMLVNELGVREPAELDGYVARGGDPGDVVGLVDFPHPPERALLLAFVTALPQERYTESFVGGAAGLLQGVDRVRFLEAAMKSRNRDVVRTAIGSAGDLRVLDLWPRLLEMMEGGDGSVRDVAEEALKSLQKYAETKATLARFGKDDQAAAVQQAEALLKSDDPVKRRGAALALGALGDRAAIAALLRLLNDTDSSVRDAALGALERLGAGRAQAPK
jgi:HEAT repeat protein/tetratricopeptide (TPR) repeat protein